MARNTKNGAGSGTNPNSLVKRRIGKRYARGHDQDSRDRQRQAGAALKWISRRADHEDHKRLRSQGLDKPAGVKFRLAGVKKMQEHVKSQKVVDRADRADE